MTPDIKKTLRLTSWLKKKVTVEKGKKKYMDRIASHSTTMNLS